ncbi:D-alanine--D-alanine ligase family protein [Deinococcus radiophilus]|uniref:D-alanine--D-alanine ligase n=1 Tax=Deinococcus radiophilus TaxID=32062 RepID=A0A3S0JX97_9DEIO|nr:D-alanine--D-alanine ligase family protein [Deinococcus radiophilus]RTR30914.1 D-alanine--D-alanine ligase [Deinococcus radiophilus]UFA49494.1 D-alanine--D-alanine ligase [Deinococcus radiophilus]
MSDAAQLNSVLSTSQPRRRVLLLAGGQSEEHEVSLSSARSVLAALPADRYDVTAVVVSKEGRWLPSSETERVLGVGSADTGGDSMLTRVAEAAGYDVVFPLLHGPMGEDGTVQGLLTLAGLPFVGSGVLGSSVGMDKIMTKRVLEAVGIPQVAWRQAARAEWRRDPQGVRDRAAELGFPQFVKPANMGSSVGVSKVHDAGELDAALDLAFRHDRRVILEAMAASKPREIEVGVLGNDDPIASPVGELRFATEFYDYDTKYQAGRAEMLIPAPLPAEVSERVRELAIEAFRALDCAGLSRVDFFYDEQTGEVLLNEINTMPGFTTTSMYPSLLEAHGLSYPELVTRLIELALEER